MRNPRVTKRKVKSAPQRAGAPAFLEDADIAQLETFKTRLIKMLTRAAPVTLDLSGLTRVNAASLQLLIAFVRERRLKGRAVLWQGAPGWFEASVQQLGLTAALAARRA